MAVQIVIESEDLNHAHPYSRGGNTDRHAGLCVPAGQDGRRSANDAEAQLLDQQWKNRWQGRQHYLFDATDAASDAYAEANPSPAASARCK